MLPINPDDIYDENSLRELIMDSHLTSEYRAKVQARLENIVASKAASAQRIEEARKRASEKPVGYKTKPKGKVDGRSAKHSVVNGVGAGGVAGAVVGIKEAVAIYDNLKDRGIAPDERTIIELVGRIMDWGLLLLIVTLFVAGITLVVKALKEY